MTEEVKNTEVPVLTTEQKYVIRDGQFRSLAAQTQAKQLVEQAQNIEQGLRQYLNDAATKLGIDSTKYTFDLDTLEFKSILTKE